MKEDLKNNSHTFSQAPDGSADQAVREALRATTSTENLKDGETPQTEVGNTEQTPTLKQVIQEQAIEGEAPLSRKFSLRKILGGDILNTAAIRRQIWLFVLIAAFMVVYIANRYGCQRDIIEIDRLQEELKDAKYKALSSTSQLTEKSRESNVMEMLKTNQDSVLKIAKQPPYIINIPE